MYSIYTQKWLKLKRLIISSVDKDGKELELLDTAYGIYNHFGK